MSADNENAILVTRIRLDEKGRSTGQERFLGAVPVESGIYETEDGVQIRIDLAGIQPGLKKDKTLKISVDNGRPQEISVNRWTGSGRVREPLGRTALRVAFIDSAPLQPNGR